MLEPELERTPQIGSLRSTNSMLSDYSPQASNRVFWSASRGPIQVWPMCKLCTLSCHSMSGWNRILSELSQKAYTRRTIFCSVGFPIFVSISYNWNSPDLLQMVDSFGSRRQCGLLGGRIGWVWNSPLKTTMEITRGNLFFGNNKCVRLMLNFEPRRIRAINDEN